jgi:hypothetical protein
MLQEGYMAICHCNSLGIGGCVVEGLSLLKVHCGERLLQGFLGGSGSEGVALSSVVSSAGDVIRGVSWGGGAWIVLSLGDRWKEAFGIYITSIFDSFLLSLCAFPGQVL